MRIKACRVCHNKKLTRIGSLGNIAMSNFTIKPSNGTTSPLELVYCASCTLLQLAHNPSRKKMYEEHYWYESSLNPTIVADLKSVVSDVSKLIKPTTGDSWIDIGANDGTLLSFIPKGFTKIGVDPAVNLSDSMKKYADKAIVGFFDKVQFQKKAKVVTAIAMFYDLPNPHLFTKKLSEVLDKNGLAVIQLMTLSPMISNNDVGNICHEHIEYYSYKSLVTLFEAHNLEIFKVDTNSMNGGSYRLFLRHKTQGSIKFSEKKYSVKELKAFFTRVEKNKKAFLSFLKKCKKQKKTVVAYGASTKGNTILQYYKLSRKHISEVVDINPEKKGRFLIKSKIPITDTIPECDYLWVLPYGFLDFFVKKEKIFIKNGGKFVVNMPRVKII